MLLAADEAYGGDLARVIDVVAGRVIAILEDFVSQVNIGHILRRYKPVEVIKAVNRRVNERVLRSWGCVKKIADHNAGVIDCQGSARSGICSGCRYREGVTAVAGVVYECLRNAVGVVECDSNHHFPQPNVVNAHRP